MSTDFGGWSLGGDRNSTKWGKNKKTGSDGPD